MQLCAIGLYQLWPTLQPGTAGTLASSPHSRCAQNTCALPCRDMGNPTLPGGESGAAHAHPDHTPTESQLADEPPRQK
eukprot:8478057-Pyramimonas_sp.AAC.1